MIDFPLIEKSQSLSDLHENVELSVQGHSMTKIILKIV